MPRGDRCRPSPKLNAPRRHRQQELSTSPEAEGGTAVFGGSAIPKRESHDRVSHGVSVPARADDRLGEHTLRGRIHYLLPSGTASQSRSAGPSVATAHSGIVGTTWSLVRAMTTRPQCRRSLPTMARGGSRSALGPITLFLILDPGGLTLAAIALVDPDRHVALPRTR